MAWAEVVIKTDKGEWSGHVSTTSPGSFSVPASSGLNVGDVFEADSKQYIADKCVDFAQRGETLLVEAKESSNDKPTTRRARGKSSGPDVQDPSDD